MSDTGKEASFENALKKLETIVESLEKGELSLDAALKEYEEGVRLADLCTKRLNEAQKKIEVILKTNPGRFKVEPLADLDNAKSKKKK